MDLAAGEAGNELIWKEMGGMRVISLTHETENISHISLSATNRKTDYAIFNGHASWEISW